MCSEHSRNLRAARYNICATPQETTVNMADLVICYLLVCAAAPWVFPKTFR